jgi:hypothetical protein
MQEFRCEIGARRQVDARAHLAVGREQELLPTDLYQGAQRRVDPDRDRSDAAENQRLRLLRERRDEDVELADREEEGMRGPGEEIIHIAPDHMGLPQIAFGKRN